MNPNFDFISVYIHETKKNVYNVIEKQNELIFAINEIKLFKIIFV